MLSKTFKMGMSSSEVTHRNTSRQNGWTWPLHPFQVIAWLVIAYLATFFYLTTAPSLISALEYANYAIFSVILVIHLIVHLLACSINPADNEVLKKMRQGDKEVATFDRTVHRHVIENFHCYICQVDVAKRSKHCSACNKCVSVFDHHCKWLNNCVGRRNYRLFLATLVSAAAGALWVAIFSLLAFIAYFTDKGSGKILRSYKEGLSGQDSASSSSISSASSTNSSAAVFKFRLYYAVVPDPAWLTLLMVTVILALLAVGLLSHLFGFHVYLMQKKLTTYDYIVKQRELDEMAARQNEADYDENSSDAVRSRKSNKVLPERNGGASGDMESNATCDGSTERQSEVLATIASPNGSSKNFSLNGRLPSIISSNDGHPSLKRNSVPVNPVSRSHPADSSDFIEPESDSAYNSTSLALDFSSHQQLHLDRMSVSVDRPDLNSQKNRKIFKPIGSRMPTDEISLTQNTERRRRNNDDDVDLLPKRKSNATQTNV